MGKIIEKNYDVEASINKQIVVLSDIHYYSKKDLKKLNKILEKVKLLKPDYICIPGDLTDEAIVNDEDTLVTWLKELSRICMVIISFGNHELFITKKHIPKINHALINKIKKIKNIKYLDNEIYSIDNISFIGLTMPLEYYYVSNEDSKLFIDYANKTFKELDDNYNILLCHSPICIGKKEVLNQLKIGKKLDLVLSGHMHGGITPNFLKKILRGRGIISPRRKLFEKNCYGLKKIDNTYYVISSGVTVASHINSFRSLDIFFSSEVSVIHFR